VTPSFGTSTFGATGATGFGATAATAPAVSCQCLTNKMCLTYNCSIPFLALFLVIILSYLSFFSALMLLDVRRCLACKRSDSAPTVHKVYITVRSLTCVFLEELAS